MAPYLLQGPVNSGRVLFDMVDIDSDKWRQYAAGSRGALRWLYRREACKLEALECKSAAAFGHTLLASDFEADTFRNITPASAAKIGGLTNGVDLEKFSPAGFESPFEASELAIVMTGRMDYRPNYEGALWFANEVFPQIAKSLPGARVYFVGSGPPRVLREIAGPKIVVTGGVADVRPYLQFAHAVIAPLLIARGIQNKVLEAMAMTKPVVATREATRSLSVQAGFHLWVENQPARFAEAVVDALHGASRETVARNARKYVEDNHNWARLLSDIDRHLEALGQAPSYDGAVALPPEAHLALSARYRS
jgi:sugar transferase (PEP-CTERM/EpsH1 system associated)